MSKNKLNKIFCESGADVMAALDREGNECEALFGAKDATKSQKIFPIIVEEYEWNRDLQTKYAKKFRDIIEYIYHPEDDEKCPALSIWRIDDMQRLRTILSLPFGKKVIESGCSSGTITIEIAKLPCVKEIIGVDLRDDAVEIANNLLKELLARRSLTSEQAEKIIFQASAIEDLKYPDSSFDSVCAFEVLEHLTPFDFDRAMSSLIRLMKPAGNFLVSVPNRYPEGCRARWNAPDHKNFFSKTSLEYYLKRYFNNLTFYPSEGISVDKGVYLICECKNKK